jgi:hypothetical protein
MHGEIIPRQDLTSDQFKQLAKALDRWCAYAVQMGFGLWISIDALEDLRLGEPPRPLAVILAAKDQTTRLSDWHKTLGNEATERTVLFKVRVGTSPELVQTSLRQSIPREFVTDIVLQDSSIFAEE